MSRLQNSISQVTLFTADCSLQEVCEGVHELEANTFEDAEKEMIKDGWLDDVIIEDSINLVCPQCVQYLKENAEAFDELDVRVGGNVSD